MSHSPNSDHSDILDFDQILCDGKTLDKKPDGEIQRLLNGGDDGARQHLSPDLSAEQIMSLLPLPPSACAELSSAAGPAQAVTAR